jgi:hypothetical protein
MSISKGARKRSISIGGRRQSSSLALSALSVNNHKMKEQTNHIRESAVDVPVSIAISTQKAASMIQRQVRAFISRRRYVLQKKLVNQERLRIQMETEDCARKAFEEAENLRLYLEMQAQLDKERQLEQEFEAARKLEEEIKLAAEAQERLRLEEQSMLAQALQKAMEERMAEEEKFRRETQIQLQLLPNSV